MAPVHAPIATELTIDGRIAPLGVDTDRFEFRWREAGEPATVRTIQLLDSSASVLWSSGEIAANGAPPVLAYAGPVLPSARVLSWRVQLDGGEWSEPASFLTGLADQAEWAGAWITDSEPTEGYRTLYFHGDCELPDDIVAAYAFSSSLGWYRLFINGADVTGPALVPRWTPFDQYVEYQAYDVTDQVRPGRNVLAMVVADGRFRGSVGHESKRAVYGDRLAAVVHIEVERADGSRVRFGTDTTWTVGGGPILTADPKQGQRVDLRLEGDVRDPAADAKSVVLLPPHPRTLIAEDVERVRAVDMIGGILTRTPAGVALVDFGQNMAGYARLRIRGEAGTRVRVSYSEVLTPEGELDVHYLDLFKKTSEWFQKDEIVLGASITDYEPWFSIFGFRYVTVESLDGTPVDIEHAEAVVVSTPLRRTATFSSSHAGLNRLWQNVEWSLRSNFLDTPTDCPTRERSGWTGDIQIFGPTAAIMVDSDAYLRRYLRNLAADQMDDGGVPTKIPREWSPFSGGKDDQASFTSAVGWGDTAVLLPLTLLDYFSDRDVLQRQYASATAWVQHLADRARTTAGAARRIGRRVGELESYIVDTGHHFGEWLRPGESMVGEMVKNMVRSPAQVATAYLSHSARLVARMARILGEDADADRFDTLADNARAAYRAAFVRHGGARIGIDKQDDYVRALAFRLLDPEEVEPALHRLVALIEAHDDHLGTGFLSTPLLLAVLSSHGRADVAYRILLQPTSPSWMAQIARGATSVWETWEGYDKKGRARMSHNHYAFGSVAQWMFEHIAGIRPLEPGYRRFAVEPVPGADLQHASGTLETRYGTISSAWRIIQDEVAIDVEVPPGTTAELKFAGAIRTLGPGKHTARMPA